MKTRAYTVWFLVAVLLVTGCSKPPGQRELEKGIRELNRGNHVRAKALLEKSIAVRPGHADNALAHNMLGIAAWRIGQLDEAMTAFEDSRRLNPNLIEPVYNLGVLAGERDDLRNAARYLNEAATMNREDPRPLEYLSELYMQRGQWTLARSALYSALDRQPRSPRIHTAIATMHAAMGQDDAAIESLMQALEADTRYAPALFNLAVLYDTRKGDADQARAYYKRFVSAAPRDIHVEAAKTALVRIAEQGTLSSTPAEAVAATPATESEVAAAPAAPSAPAAPVPEPTAFEALIAQAVERAAAGQIQPALDLCVRAAELAARDRRYDLQERAYREAVRIAIDQPRAHVLLAQFLYDRGRYDQAASSFRQAVTLNADYAPGQLGMARITARRNEFDAAVIHYRRAIASDPTLADAHWELALLYDRSLELPGNAAAAYRAFAQKFPGDSRRQTGLERAEELSPTPRPETRAGASRREAGPLPPDPANARRIEYRAPQAPNRDAAIKAYGRAVEYQGRGEWDRAVFYFLRTLENDDRIPEAFYNLGICYTMTGDPELARDAYRRALRIRPDMEDAQYNLALLLNQSGETDAAVRQLETIVSRNDRYASAHYALGVIFAADPATHVKAKRHYARFLDLAPDDRSAAVIRAWIDSH